MIDRNTALKLQALLDGELASTEVSAMKRLLRENAEARRLYEELEKTRTFVREHEPRHLVPGPRELYWAPIRRATERRRPVGHLSWAGGWNGWLRWAVPVGATALLGLLLLQRAMLAPEPDPVMTVSGHGEETLLADITSISFRSESAGTTVVWVQTGQPIHLVSGD
jgi:anti-sigma factor RsiW